MVNRDLRKLRPPKKPSLTITDYFMIDPKSIKKTTTKNGVTIWTNKGIPYCKCGGMRKGISKTKKNWKRTYYCCLKYRKSKTGKKKSIKTLWRIHLEC